MTDSPVKNIYTGIGLAVLAAFIWSGNFVVARGLKGQIQPVSLSFYRWFFASIILLPFAFRQFKKDWPVIFQSRGYFFWVSLTGIALFNTFVYVAGHYTSAINLALIGTASSPIMANILARIFLKEKIGIYKILGIILCVSGVLFLLSKGHFSNLLLLQFSEGDGWVLLAAFCFAVYNTLVRKKPTGISVPSFLLAAFMLGTVLLFPFFLWECFNSAPVHWNVSLMGAIAYLSLGASVISFWIWNIAIGQLGAGRTALFGNLIPIFSSIEAVIWLHESFDAHHIIGMLIVSAGLAVANIPLFFKSTAG